MKNKEQLVPKCKTLLAREKFIKWASDIRHIFWLICAIAFLFFTFKLMPHRTLSVFWSSFKTQGTLVSMVIIFSIVSVSLVWSVGQRLDVWVFMFLNMRGHRPRWVDRIMLGLTQIGNGIFALALSIILYLLINHLLAYELALGTLTLWLVVEFMKVIFCRSRPYMKLSGIRIVGSRDKGSSFPSGHTSQSFFMATLVLNHFQAGLLVSIALYAIALFVGITRIYVGMHYPRDVLGGAILGTSWGLLGAIVNNYISVVMLVHV